MCLVQKFKFDEKFKYSLKIQMETKERKRKKNIMSATTTSLQELPQCEEDSFISDDPDDKFYDDNIYNWEVMFETVKFFLMKEGRWPRCEREEDKRYVVMADDSIVLRDLAQWMSNQRKSKFKGKLLYERERKLDSIRFMWDRWEHEWHAMFCAVKRFKDKEGRWPREKKAEDKREVVLADGKPVLRDLAKWMDTQKTAKGKGKLIPFREEKLNEIGFPFHNRNKRKRQPDPSSITTAYRKKKRTISDYL